MSSNKSTNKRAEVTESVSIPGLAEEQQREDTITPQFSTSGFQEQKGDDETDISNVSVTPFGLGLITHGTPVPNTDISLISPELPVDPGMFTSMIQSNKKMKVISESSQTKPNRAKPDVVIVHVYGNNVSGLLSHPHYNSFVAHSVCIVGFYHDRRFLKGEVEKNRRKCPLMFQCRYPFYMHKVLECVLKITHTN
jgi:hypothetical protein